MQTSAPSVDTGREKKKTYRLKWSDGSGDPSLLINHHLISFPFFSPLSENLTIMEFPAALWRPNRAVRYERSDIWNWTTGAASLCVQSASNKTRRKEAVSWQRITPAILPLSAHGTEKTKTNNDSIALTNISTQHWPGDFSRILIPSPRWVILSNSIRFKSARHAAPLCFWYFHIHPDTFWLNVLHLNSRISQKKLSVGLLISHTNRLCNKFAGESVFLWPRWPLARH